MLNYANQICRDTSQPIRYKVSAHVPIIKADLPPVITDIAINKSSCDASAGESLAEALIRVAKASGCHTIAVGREHGSGLADHLHHHTAENLAPKAEGFALWLIE